MSDYKILHVRLVGEEVWRVHYKDDFLDWTPPVRIGNQGIYSNRFNNIEDAKEVVRLHKEHLQWIEEQKKNDVKEWLDEDGNFIDNYNEPTYHVEKRPKNKVVIVGLCVLAALIGLLLLV